MNKFIILIVLILFPSICLAAAAINVQLTYNVETKRVHLEASHPTDHPEKNFIRRVVFTINSQVSQAFSYARQKSPVKFVEYYELKVEPGDHIDVQMYSSEGGLAEASLDIPKSIEEGKDKNE
jgi:hypothetical protein